MHINIAPRTMQKALWHSLTQEPHVCCDTCDVLFNRLADSMNPGTFVLHFPRIYKKESLCPEACALHIALIQLEDSRDSI